jgi:endonuclease YncB( thermonuclease family)
MQYLCCLRAPSVPDWALSLRELCSLRAHSGPKVLEPIHFSKLHYTNGPVECAFVSAHDGDTIDVQLDLMYVSRPVIMTVRLIGYDCAEIIPKGPTRTKIDKLQEKILGTLGKYALLKKIEGSNLTIHLQGKDKYGRVLGILYSNGVNINNYMLESNFAYMYQGATKDCASYVAANFNKCYSMIVDGTIVEYVSTEGAEELRKLAEDFILLSRTRSIGNLRFPSSSVS